MVNDEARAEILHEHYNKTFENIQAHIVRRERLLFALLLLVVVMLFQMAFPSDASQQIAELVAKKLDMNKPCNTAFVDSVLWFGMLCLIIRYCQTVVYVERQYVYIHEIENRLNQLLGKEDITREGKTYLAKYPRFSDWTHFVYTIGFPLLLGSLLILKWKSELGQTFGISVKISLDTAILVACLVSLLLYMRLIHLKR